MQVHKTVVESVMGENEIMEKNILNVVKGMKCISSLVES